MLDLHEQVRDLSREQGRLERELESVETDIERAEAEIAKEDDLRERKADLDEEIASLRGRIDDLERTAVDTLQDYLDDFVERLGYDNLARVRVDRVNPDVTTSQFTLSIVREGPDGAREEPQGLQTLSESERVLIGVVVALAGYQTHNVGETVPMLLLDSIEEFDAERIGRLIEYIADEVPRVVCALLPEDADSVAATEMVSAAQLGAD